MTGKLPLVEDGGLGSQLHALPHFGVTAWKPWDLQKKCIKHETCVLFLSATFAWNIFRSEKYLTRYSREDN
jgi:hypothetical protein